MYENVVLNFSLVAHFIYFHWRQDSAVYPFFPFFVWTTCHSVCVQWTVYSCMNVSCTVYYTASTHKVTLIIAMMVKNLWFGCARGNEWIHLHRWHQFTLFFGVLIMNQLSFGNLSPTLLSGDIFTCEKWAPTKATQYRTHVLLLFSSLRFVSLWCYARVHVQCTCIVSTGYSARKNLIISCY